MHKHMRHRIAGREDEYRHDQHLEPPRRSVGVPARDFDLRVRQGACTRADAHAPPPRRAPPPPLCPVPVPCATPSNARRHDRATCRSPTRRRRALTDPALRARHRGCRGCARCCSPRSVVRGAPSTRPPLSARGCTGKSRSRALRLPCTFCARATKIRVWGVQTRPAGSCHCCHQPRPRLIRRSARARRTARSSSLQQRQGGAACRRFARTRAASMPLSHNPARAYTSRLALGRCFDDRTPYFTGCVPFSHWIWSLWAALSARVRPCGLGECC